MANNDKFFLDEYSTPILITEIGLFLVLIIAYIQLRKK